MYNIAVIGAGVIGLTTALKVQEDVQNSKIIIYAEKLTPHTTGDLSAGFWTPYLLENTPEDDITRWAKVTHDYLHKLWKTGFAKKAGISLIPVLLLHTKENQKPNWLKIPFGSTTLPLEYVQKLNKHLGTNYKEAIHYVTFTCEPTKLLPMLMQKFTKNGGKIVNQRINDFAELSNFDVIINCAGLEARTLTKDDNVHAIRGQISRVQAPWQYSIISDDGFYIIPNMNYVILGGTHQVGDENLQIDLNDKQKILEGCEKIIPGLKGCKNYIDGVGLRPGRSKVRIDSQRLLINNRTVIIINNYGHGGAGVTLCFGCAEDASKLVIEELQIISFKSHL